MSTKLRWHLGHLDALRGLAMLSVLLVHSWYWFDRILPIPLYLRHVAFAGQRGVQLFFIVSAFTLFMSNDNRREEKHQTLNFFLRRFFRLAPMFYIALALTYFILNQYVGKPWEMVLSVFFLHGLIPSAIVHGPAGGWSVADEALFYLCLPFLFRHIRNLRTSMIYLCIGMPVCFLIARSLGRRYPIHAEYFTFHGYFVEIPVFLMGITGYFLWKEYVADQPLFSTSARQHVSIFLLIVATLMYISNLPFYNGTLYPTSAIGLLLLLALSLHPWSLIVNTFTRFFGKVSYSFYLLHFYICFWVQRLLVRSVQHGTVPNRPVVLFVLCFIGTLVFTLPLATATWKWIEEPGIRLGRRLIAHLEARNQVNGDTLVPPLRAVIQDGNSPDAQF